MLRALTHRMPVEVERKGAVGSWTRDELEDQYLRLYDDYLTLKKHGCKQEERIKKMATKLLRLANDKKNGAANAVWEDDYREQIEALERKNAALSQKLLLAQNQLNVQRQRVGSAPSAGRPVNRANIRTLAGTPRDNRGKEVGATAGALQTARMQNAALEQTIKKLSEHLQERERTIGQLKEELLTKDANHQQDMQALMQQLTSKQRDKLKENIDLIRNQRELREKQLQIATLEARIHDMEADRTATAEANRKLVAEVERLTGEIGSLEQKNIRLENAASSATNEHLKVLELQNAYDDVKRENDVLKESNEKLMANAFAGMSEQNWLRQEQKLRAHINQLEAMLQKQSASRISPTAEESVVRAQILSAEASAPPAAKPGSTTAPKTITASTAVTIAQAAGFNQDELEEALMLLRERKSRHSAGNEDLGFLEKVSACEAQDVAKRLKESETAHAETIAELEKTRKLLSVQYRINKDYRTEASEVSERLAAVKSESEQRLAEYAKLLDIRAARIRQLEAQLEEKAYGTKSTKASKATDVEGCSEEMITSNQLAPNTSAPKRGENLIEIHVGQLNLSANAANQLLAAVRPDQTDPDSRMTEFSGLRLFLTWDFYDFETQATPLRNGISADFNLTVQYPVTMDDYMLGYLHRGQCTVELHQNLEGRYRTVATGQLNMASLLDTSDLVGSTRNAEETVARRHGQLELYGSTGGSAELFDCVIGKLDYWIRLSVPMPQALRIYRERFRGLPRPVPPRSGAHLATSTAASARCETIPVSKTGPGVEPCNPLSNQLHIYVTQVTDLRARRPDFVPSPYFVYQFYDQPEVVSPIMDACSNAKFDNLQSFPVQMDEKLDQYLRTQDLTIYVLDSADPEEAASCLGGAVIPLLSLVTRPADRIEGVFALHALCDLERARGIGGRGNAGTTAGDSRSPNGLVHVKIYWHTPYAFGQQPRSGQESVCEDVTAATLSTMQNAKRTRVMFDDRLNKALAANATSNNATQSSRSGPNAMRPGQTVGPDSSLTLANQVVPEEMTKNSSTKKNVQFTATDPRQKRENLHQEQQSSAGSSRKPNESVERDLGQIGLPVLSLRRSRDRLDESHSQQTSRATPNENDLGSKRMSPTVHRERVLSSPDQTSTEDPGMPRPRPRSKLDKSRSPVPNAPTATNIPPGAKLNRAEVVNSPRHTPILNTDENHVQISLHRIELVRKPANWKNWSPSRRLFVEYRFLGYADPFETSSSVLHASNDSSGNQLQICELNYTRTFEVDFTDNYERRQHLASFLLADDPKHGQLSFVVVAEPMTTGNSSQSTECEEIGIARVNVQQILLNASEPMEKLIPIYPVDSKENNQTESSLLGHLCVSIRCLSALRSIVSEMPGVQLAV